MEKPSVSFADDIRPLFRDIDIAHMSPFGVLLDDYAYMSNPDNATLVYAFLDGTREPRMPIRGPYWTDAQLKLYSDWMAGGRQP